MIELTEKAYKYAAQNASEVIANVLAKAYEDGYREGYKDCKEEIPVDLRDNRNEFVDLGLPSGTLWANDYETEDGIIMYLPYVKASGFNLPTEEQWKELLEICKWQGRYSSSGQSFYGITIIGPNGNCIKLGAKGYMQDEIEIGKPKYGGGSVRFWLKNHQDTSELKAIKIEKGSGCTPIIEVANVFSGYKLPIRLVKIKK